MDTFNISAGKSPSERWGMKGVFDCALLGSDI
jgi:hypothetical protein